MKVIPEMRRAN